MKSLKDSLRDEFDEILEDEKYKTIIESNNMESDLIKKAFEKLLDNMRNGLTDEQLNDGRSQFQNFIINHFKG